MPPAASVPAPECGLQPARIVLAREPNAVASLSWVLLAAAAFALASCRTAPARDAAGAPRGIGPEPVMVALVEVVERSGLGQGDFGGLLLHAAEARRAIRLSDARGDAFPFARVLASDAAAAAAFRQRWPADVYLRADVKECRALRHIDERPYRDGDRRVNEFTFWVEASCQLRVDAVDVRGEARAVAFTLTETAESAKQSGWDEVLRHATVTVAQRRAAEKALTRLERLLAEKRP